jgi:ArsR family transcriptional regulator
VLEVLSGGERSVGDLAAVVGLELPALSQQLAVLRRAGVVSTRRDGNTVFYSLRDERMAGVLALAREMIVASLEQSRDVLDRMLEPGAAR